MIDTDITPKRYAEAIYGRHSVFADSHEETLMHAHVTVHYCEWMAKSDLALGINDPKYQSFWKAVKEELNKL